MRKVRVKALLEMSEHDGYCSGNECEYTSKEKVIVIPVPQRYQDAPLGLLTEIDQEVWNQILPGPVKEERSYHQSGWCSNDPEADKRRLFNHDYRYTVYSVEIFDDAAS